jgi:hypothetical protein
MIIVSANKKIREFVMRLGKFEGIVLDYFHLLTENCSGALHARMLSQVYD